MKAPRNILTIATATATAIGMSTTCWTRTTTTSAFVPLSSRSYNRQQQQVTKPSERDRLLASALEVDISNEENVFGDGSNGNGNGNGNSNEGSGGGGGDESESVSEQQQQQQQQQPANKLPSDMLNFPRHSSRGVNDVLIQTEALVKHLHRDSRAVDPKRAGAKRSTSPMVSAHDSIFANTYVDFGNIDTVGFDYDYTLVHYTEELLTLLYSMALERLVMDRHYPIDMLSCGRLQYDPFFSIRGLAVDKETGWICHLSYTHKVAVAWEGREKVSTSRIFKEYRGKRGLNPRERKVRLQPLNDLFSMAECCLIADTIQYFKDQNIDFCPTNVVHDVVGAIGDTHMSGDFHRMVADNPKKYFDPTPHLKEVLGNLKDSGKRLIFASNSPFWYVDAGMKYVVGDDWIDMWDAVIVSAGKPAFYTETKRPFREVNTETNRVRYQKVEKLQTGKVYTGGCLAELTKLMDWEVGGGGSGSGTNGSDNGTTVVGVGKKNDDQKESMGPLNNLNSNVLYIGDSLFADLVDAKREYGWITAAVTPEVGFELDVQQSSDHLLAERTITILLNALRKVQAEMGTRTYTVEDSLVLDKIEKLVSRWRDRQTNLLGNPFGTVFRARYQPSLFAHSLRRYCDLYMNSIGSLRLYSPQHRFYPESDFRLLAHEIQRSATDAVVGTLPEPELEPEDGFPETQ